MMARPVRAATGEDAARRFALLNVLGFPAAAYLLGLVLRGLVILGAPAVAAVVVASATGVALVALNIWLTWRAARGGASRASVVAMAGWSALCVGTLVVLGSFSPLTLALNYGFADLMAWR